MELQTERLAIFQLLRFVSDDDMTSGAGWESVLNKIFVSFIIMKKTGKVRCTVLVFCWQKLSKVNNFQLCLFVDEKPLSVHQLVKLPSRATFCQISTTNQRTILNVKTRTIRTSITAMYLLIRPVLHSR